MELLIKQRVFSWTDTYDVYDETGAAKYFVKAEFLTLGHQIHVYDKRTGAELGSVHQRLFTLMPTFDLVIDGRTRGTVRKKSHCSGRTMRWIFAAGTWREIFWAGITGWCREPRKSCPFPKNCSAGGIPMRCAIPTRFMNSRVCCWLLPLMPPTAATETN